jgi:hypothetical protein
MTKEDKKAAIALAVKEHLDNKAAVDESEIPAGLAQVVAQALAESFAARLGRIFDPGNQE